LEDATECKRTRAHPREGTAGIQPDPKPPKPKFNKHRFCRYYDTKVLPDLPFSRNQPLKSADDWYIRILKNKLIKLK
jgi:hypothetical protein